MKKVRSISEYFFTITNNITIATGNFGHVNDDDRKKLAENLTRKNMMTNWFGNQMKKHFSEALKSVIHLNFAKKFVC